CDGAGCGSTEPWGAVGSGWELPSVAPGAVQPVLICPPAVRRHPGSGGGRWAGCDVLQDNLRTPGPCTDPTNVDGRASSGHPTIRGCARKVSAGGTMSRMTTPSRILVVDDDQAIAEMVGIVLRGKGYEVATSPDGASALETFPRLRPDLVLLDLMLPGM